MVCLAGAAGTGARYLIALAAPAATLTVNVLGSFAIGAATAWGIRKGWPVSTLSVITTGFLGGFTTYSAFNHELTLYLTQGQSVKAAGYALLMVGACLLAGLAGLHLAR